MCHGTHQIAYFYRSDGGTAGITGQLFLHDVSGKCLFHAVRHGKTGDGLRRGIGAGSLYDAFPKKLAAVFGGAGTLDGMDVLETGAIGTQYDGTAVCRVQRVRGLLFRTCHSGSGRRLPDDPVGIGDAVLLADGMDGLQGRQCTVSPAAVRPGSDPLPDHCGAGTGILADSADIFPFDFGSFPFRAGEKCQRGRPSGMVDFTACRYSCGRSDDYLAACRL